MEERSGVYWNGISHERIVDWLREPTTDSLVDSVDQWERGLGDRFQRVTELIDQALHASGAVWDGQAADQMRAGVSPLAQFAVEAGETARSVGAGARQVADSFEHLRREMPPVPARPDPDAWVTAPVADLVTGRVDQELAEQEARDAAERARDLMREYEGAVGEATHGLPVFTPVPAVGSGGGIADRLVTTFGATAPAPLAGGPAPAPGTPPAPAPENTGRAGTLPPQYQPGAVGGTPPTPPQPGAQPAPPTPPAPAHPGGPASGNPVPSSPPGGGAATATPAPGATGPALPGGQGSGPAPVPGGPTTGTGSGGPPAGAGQPGGGAAGQPQPGTGRAPAPQPFVPPGTPPPPAPVPPAAGAPAGGAPAGGGHAFGPAAGALPTAGPSSHEHPGRPGGAATGTRRANAHPEDGAGRETADYLEDTDDVWGDGDRVAPPVLGMPAGEEHR